VSNAKWLNIPGVSFRRRSPDDTFSCDVEAASSEADDVFSVEFTVWQGTTLLSRQTKTAREKRVPDWSEYPSRLPGVAEGLAPSHCWGITLVCRDLPPGQIRISAIVKYSSTGPSETLPDVLLLIDRDGIDRRYNSQTLYVKGQTGSDSASGSAAAPVKSINKAIKLLGANLGGATIVVDEDVVGMGPSETENWTTGDQFLTVKFLPGSTWRRAPGDSSGPNYFVCANVANIRIQNMDCRGLGPIFHGGGFPVSTAKYTVWAEHCEQHSAYWSASGPRWSANHLRDQGAMISFSGPTNVLQESRAFFTSFLSKGAAYGPAGISGIYDFVIEDYIGIALQSVGDRQGDFGINGTFKSQRSRSIDVKGYLSCRGGTSFTVSQPAAGQMKIAATGPIPFSDSLDNDTSTTVDIADQVAEIVGSDYWWINLENFGTHSGRHQVLSVGHDPNPFIVLDYPGTVTPGVAGSTARLRTIRDNGGPYDPHPDLIQWFGNRLRTFHKNILAEDINDSQGWFVSGEMTDLVLINVTDGKARNPIGVLRNAIIQNASFKGSLDFGSGDFVTENTVIRDCVISNLSNPPAGVSFRRCHFVNPAQARGTSPTTGPFFAGSDWTPLASKFNLGELLTCPPEWQWPGSADSPNTQGAFANVGRFNWGFAGNTGLSLSFLASSTTTLAMSMGKALSMTSAGSSTTALSMGVRRGFLMVSLGSSSTTLAFARLIPMSWDSTASSSTQLQMGLRVALSLQSLGTALTSLSMSLGGVVDLTLSSIGTSNTSMSMQVQKAPVIQVVVTQQAGETKSQMKQRIHNALLALCNNGPYHACSYDKKTGQMTIDLEKPIKPTRVVVKELRSSYRPARLNKRDYGSSELETWAFIARVEFPNAEVSCESFETAVTDAAIKIPKVVGIDDSLQRSLLARLSGADYTHPPEQSPNVGTFADFSFEIVTELLRK